MTGFVLAAVLIAALVHAIWNALIKAQADKFSAAAMVAIGAGVASVLAGIVLLVVYGGGGSGGGY